MNSFNRVIKSERVFLIRTDSRGDVPPVSPRDAGGARDAIQKTREEAFQQGLKEGMRKGREQKSREMGELIQALQSAAGDLHRRRERVLRGAEQQMLRIAVAMAEKVLHQEIALRRDVIQGVLKDAMQHVIDRQGIRIRLHPEDCRYLKESCPDGVPDGSDGSGIVFDPDPSIRRGGALIETPSGDVDARIEQQWRHVATEVLRAADVDDRAP